jgi:hypothetical protein
LLGDFLFAFRRKGGITRFPTLQPTQATKRHRSGILRLPGGDADDLWCSAHQLIMLER